MKKSKVYSGTVPYLAVTAILLSVLLIQSNWEALNLFQEKDKGGISPVSLDQGRALAPVRSSVLASVPGDGKKTGKAERILSLFTGDKEKGWGYKRHNGPGKWAGLDPAYTACKSGKSQSPVALVSKNIGQGFEPLFYYKGAGGEVVNNGQTVKIIVGKGSFLRVLGQDYPLKQIHFHTPSEHSIDQKTYPMEAHLVHQSHEGHIVVVAIMFVPAEKDDFNGLVDLLPLPEEVGVREKIKGMSVDPAALLPPRHSRSYFAYDGSLTTPPCTENIGWIVMKTPVIMSLNKINRMRQLMKANRRPVQSLNSRKVHYSR